MDFLGYLSCFIPIPFIGWWLFVAYSWYRLKHSKKITGMDRYMLDYVDEDTIYSCLHFTDPEIDMDQYYAEVKEVVKRVITDDRKESKRYVDGKRIRYDKEIDWENLDHIVNMIVSCQDEISYDQEIQMYHQPHIDNLNPFKIVLDRKNKMMWIVGNHAYMDGFTMMRICLDILSVDEKDTYQSKLPQFNYIPFITDLMILRTMYDLHHLNPPALKPFDGIERTDASKIQYITHIKMKIDRTTNIETKNFIPSYVHRMMQIFFEMYRDKDYFNVVVLCAIYNPNKINNIGMLTLQINRNDQIIDIENELNRIKSYQAIGSYFLVNSIKNTKKSSIDIVFSSIPGFRSDKYGYAGGAVLPCVSWPIYVFNSKIGDTCTSSIHLRPDYADHMQFIKVVQNKRDIEIHKITKMY